VECSHEIEPVVGADAVSACGRQHSSRLKGLARESHRGRRPGHVCRGGRPGTWETLPPPRQEVRPGEVYEARRMGGRESEHLHSTGEAGEPIPRDPVEGRRVSEHGTDGGKDGWERRVSATSLRNSSG
jgi:hypothetical protein